MSLALSPTGPELVNKRELAQVLGVSLPTLAAWIERYPEFPVLDRGTNGREWQFDAAAVVAYVQSITSAEAAEAAERQARIAQLALPLADPGDAAQEGGLTLEEIRRIRENDRLRIERGFLVQVPALRMKLEAALGQWAGRERSIIQQAGRDLNLPPAVVRAISDRLAEGKRAWLADLARAVLAPKGGADGAAAG